MFSHQQYEQRQYFSIPQWLISNLSQGALAGASIIYLIFLEFDFVSAGYTINVKLLLYMYVWTSDYFLKHWFSYGVVGTCYSICLRDFCYFV